MTACDHVEHRERFSGDRQGRADVRGSLPQWELCPVPTCGHLRHYKSPWTGVRVGVTDSGVSVECAGGAA